jgi:hypothetical protein
MAADAVLFARSNRALDRRVGVDVLVTTPDDERVHHLSGGAAAVWAHLSAPRSLTELVDGLARTYRVPPERIHREIASCVDDLVGIGVIEVVGSDG